MPIKSNVFVTTTSYISDGGTVDTGGGVGAGAGALTGAGAGGALLLAVVEPPSPPPEPQATNKAVVGTSNKYFIGRS